METGTLGWGRAWKLRSGDRWKENVLERVFRAEKGTARLTSWDTSLNYPWNVKWSVSHSSRVGLFETSWTAAHQAPLPMGFSRQEYWSGFPCPPSGDIPNQGLNSCLLHLLHWQEGSLPLGPPGRLWVEFYCMDITPAIYSFTRWETFGLFPVWGIDE